MQKLGLLLAMLFITAGCVTSISKWPDPPRARGAFCLRTSTSFTAPEYFTDGEGREFAGTFRLTPETEFEVSYGSWEAFLETFEYSLLMSVYGRATFYYSLQLGSHFVLRAGAGATLIGGNYSMSMEEMMSLAGMGEDYPEISIYPTLGSHIAFDITYVSKEGTSIGAVFIDTTSDVDTLYNSSSALNREGKLNVNNKFIGISIGARF